MNQYEEKEVQAASNQMPIDDEKRAYSNCSPTRAVSIRKVDTTNADLGLRILQDRGHQGDYELDPAMRRRILRKIDWHLMPVLT